MMFCNDRLIGFSAMNVIDYDVPEHNGSLLKTSIYARNTSYARKCHHEIYFGSPNNHQVYNTETQKVSEKRYVSNQSIIINEPNSECILLNPSDIQFYDISIIDKPDNFAKFNLPTGSRWSNAVFSKDGSKVFIFGSYTNSNELSMLIGDLPSCFDMDFQKVSDNNKFIGKITPLPLNKKLINYRFMLGDYQLLALENSIVMSLNKSIYIYNIETGKWSQCINSNFINAMSVHPSEKYLATTDTVGDVQIWDLQTLSIVQKYNWGFSDGYDVVYSSDGMKLAMCGKTAGKAKDNKNIIIWDSEA